MVMILLIVAKGDCSANCKSCINATYCTYCNEGYTGNVCDKCIEKYYNKSGVCTACPTNCHNCSDASTCLACENGF
jgi:hypothetical protein